MSHLGGLGSNISMNSYNNNYFNNNDYAYQWLRAVLEDRDRNFHPLQGLQGRNVYILTRHDYQ